MARAKNDNNKSKPLRKRPHVKPNIPEPEKSKLKTYSNININRCNKFVIFKAKCSKCHYKTPPYMKKGIKNKRKEMIEHGMIHHHNYLEIMASWFSKETMSCKYCNKHLKKPPSPYHIGLHLIELGQLQEPKIVVNKV